MTKRESCTAGTGSFVIRAHEAFSIPVQSFGHILSPKISEKIGVLERSWKLAKADPEAVSCG